jgi:lipid-A-disaccharide synthase
MLARRMIRVEHVAMVNLLAGRRVVPELLQQDCTPARLAETVRQLIADPEVAAAQRAAFGPVLASLRPPGEEEPAAAAAEAVLGLLRPPPMLRESGLM